MMEGSKHFAGAKVQFDNFVAAGGKKRVLSTENLLREKLRSRVGHYHRMNAITASQLAYTDPQQFEELIETGEQFALYNADTMMAAFNATGEGLGLSPIDVERESEELGVEIYKKFKLLYDMKYNPRAFLLAADEAGAEKALSNATKQPDKTKLMSKAEEKKAAKTELPSSSTTPPETH